MPLLPTSIEERICPSLNRFGFGDASRVRSSVQSQFLLLAALQQQQGCLQREGCHAVCLAAWQHEVALTVMLAAWH